MKKLVVFSFLLLLLGKPSLWAFSDQATLLCMTQYLPPPPVVNITAFPQACNLTVRVWTDAGTSVGTHSVGVTDGSNNKNVFYFDVVSGGAITGKTSDLHSYGPTSTGSQGFYSTVVGTQTVVGNNFPMYGGGAISPTYFNTIFIRDGVLGTTLTFDNSDTVVIKSNSTYTAVYDPLFFNYGPYVPGITGPVAAINKTVIMDFRGGIKTDPNAPPDCTTCSKCRAMAGASLDRFHAGIVVTDTPISYSPAVGMAMNFTVSYRQRLTNQPSTFTYSNLGPQWSGGWVSYIAGGTTNNQDEATHVAADGTQYLFTDYEQVAAQGIGATYSTDGDYPNPQTYTHATLHYRHGPERYELWGPDGSVQKFGLAVGTAPNRQFFLTSITDPQGNTTTLNYDPVAAAAGNAVLTSVSDPLGGKLTFGYNTASPLLITKVTRSCDGLSAKFNYTGGKLTSITDTIGMTSSFHYVSGSTFIDKMTTPYGDTTFSSTDGTTYLEADMTNPLGQTERVEYQENLSTSLVAASDASVPSATGLTIDNSGLNTASSFYWSRREYADGLAAGSVDSAPFYAKAEVTHWAQTGLGSTSVPLSTKKPLEGRVWYNYPSQPDADHIAQSTGGVTTSPSVTARLVDSGGSTTTQVSFASYNANGQITQSIDPLGRTTNYTYDTNGIDLLTVKQVNGGGQDTLSTMTYNSAHLPLTVTDASDRTTTMTYNTQGQLLTRAVVVGGSTQTTTLAYYTSGSTGYLHTVTGPVSGATTTYAYDSVGRVSTVTDSEGYVVTTAYDNLDRPVTVTYPDSTTDQTVYKALDVIKTTDRQGRSTRNRYDAIRELLQTTDPLGRTTKYSWCTCGGLSTLTDANGNVTTWGLDLQGRVTGKTYADSSAIAYTYETNTSRLHQMTDAVGNVAVYAYNTDNTLSGTTYTPASGVASTPNVSFTYDTPYNRVLTMVDGTGTTTYAYNAVYSSGSAITGGGRLHTVTSPIAGSTAVVAYSYDELGRVTSRTVDGGSTVGTTFDSLGRVTGVSNPLGSFTYAYLNQTSRLSSVTYPSGTGLSTTYAYFNNAGDQRLQTIQNLKSGSTNISKFDYTYNAVGTIATWTQQADSSTAVVNTLSYDGADQLTNAVQSGGGSASNAYHYDPAGNRLAETTGSGTNAGQFNNLNQLTTYNSSTTATTVAGHTNLAASSVTVNAIPATITSSTNFSASVPLPSGTNVVSIVAKPTSGAPVTQREQIITTGTAPISLTYDANGNTLTDENGNTYKWDALNRLTAIIYPGGTHTEFAYDGLSRRIQIVERAGTSVGSGTVASTKNYLWIGSEIAEERDASNTVTKRFFPQGEQQSGTSYYYTSDHLRSVREMCNTSGSIVSRMAYDPYGRTTTVSGTILPTKQYAGYFQHQTSGLSLTEYRAYNENTGKWLSRDPISENGGINLYQYVRDNPINLVDPSGLTSVHYVPSADIDPIPPSDSAPYDSNDYDFVGKVRNGCGDCFCIYRKIYISSPMYVRITPPHQRPAKFEDVSKTITFLYVYNWDCKTPCRRVRVLPAPKLDAEMPSAVTAPPDGGGP